MLDDGGTAEQEARMPALPQAVMIARCSLIAPARDAQTGRWSGGVTCGGCPAQLDPAGQY